MMLIGQKPRTQTVFGQCLSCEEASVPDAISRKDCYRVGMHCISAHRHNTYQPPPSHLRIVLIEASRPQPSHSSQIAKVQTANSDKVYRGLYNCRCSSFCDSGLHSTLKEHLQRAPGMQVRLHCRAPCFLLQPEMQQKKTVRMRASAVPRFSCFSWGRGGCITRARPEEAGGDRIGVFPLPTSCTTHACRHELLPKSVWNG
ncbi:hypothetical protein K431DRAFT_100270 [Polychaeton citri CBS 116435]|uniref:Uncharacterized protein n=1 Tax=Polychaeton citri CBS 116435 TaxID=1314669 RepID=A0A9P4QIC5_9PEZI|nr:hypothetical protein K431DRAFT_100270 [Polychaeton citri CBS 116435]